MEAGTVDRPDGKKGAARAKEDPDEKGLTIGSVCRQLRSEFPDISISKIRYLEEQKLVSPRRTEGGYRLYSVDDLNLLRAVLRTQRDKFLPLRVIRKEIAAGRIKIEPVGIGGSSEEGTEGGGSYTLDQVAQATGADARLVRELEEHGIISGKLSDGDYLYTDTDKEIIAAAMELSRFGVAGKNLRVLKRSADKEAALLEQILAPALRSKNDARRRQARESLESLAGVVSRLKHQLLLRSTKSAK